MIHPHPLSDAFTALDHDPTDANAPFLKKTKGALIACVGKKRSGKTTLFMHLLTHPEIYKGYFSNIFMISPSDSDPKVSGLIDELKKEEKFYKELTEANIKSILDFIQHENDLIQQKRIKVKKGKRFNLLVLDDCVTDLPRTMKRNFISNIFYNQRHYNLSIILVSQSYRNIPPNIRKQIDMLHFFPATNLKEREALQDDWDVPDEVLDICQEGDDHPFLTMNLSGKRPVFFRKFDKISL
jgi:hypothetical protein